MERPVVAGVYFLRMGDFVKIGVSRDVLSRVERFATGAPAPLAILGVIPDAGRADEQDLHARFATHHANGEWFHARDELLAEAARWAAHVPTLPPRMRETIAPARPRRPGPGRPATGRRIWKINVWVSPADRKRIQDALEAKGETAGAVARRALFEAAGIAPEEPASEE
jgi:hypothetical protein